MLFDYILNFLIRGAFFLIVGGLFVYKDDPFGALFFAVSLSFALFIADRIFGPNASPTQVGKKIIRDLRRRKK